MAHTISALRQHKQSEIRRQRNHAVKSELRTQMKKVLGEEKATRAMDFGVLCTNEASYDLTEGS